MPYRIDIASPPDDALEQLVQLGALDIEPQTKDLPPSFLMVCRWTVWSALLAEQA